MRWILLLAVPAVMACEGGTEPEGGPEVRADTVGDTIRVHTITGSAWGAARELVPALTIEAVEGPGEAVPGSVTGLAGAPDGGVYVYDRQVAALRRYGPDGVFMRTLGGVGVGPGEYTDPDGGLAVLPDGRVVLRDPGNARFTVYGPDGGYRSEWPGRGSFDTAQPLGVDTAGRIYTVVNRRAEGAETAWPGRMWVTRVLRIGPDGTALDTLDIPRYAFESTELRAEGESGPVILPVPYTGRFHWVVHPWGGLVTAVGDRYVVDFHRPDGRVVRMVRNPEPVRVDPEEKAAVERSIVESMRHTVPDWTWAAVSIPDAKAPIEGLSVGRDGRIWVRVATPSVRLAAPGEPAGDTASAPAFRAPPAWDVFEADGTYLGRVNAPVTLALDPEPIFAGDHVWAVTRDSPGVSHVRRFRIAEAARAR